MANDERRPRFHLAIGVSDLDAARVFYGELLGCEQGRSAEHWVDWNFYGHQVVTHRVPTEHAGVTSPVDGDPVPVPHFGVILEISQFHELATQLRSRGAAFVIEPHLRVAGEVGEQWTMFLRDPAGNALEFKAFADDARVFAREA